MLMTRTTLPRTMWISIPVRIRGLDEQPPETLEPNTLIYNADIDACEKQDRDSHGASSVGQSSLDSAFAVIFGVLRDFGFP